MIRKICAHWPENVGFMVSGSCRLGNRSACRNMSQLGGLALAPNLKIELKTTGRSCSDVTPNCNGQLHGYCKGTVRVHSAARANTFTDVGVNRRMQCTRAFLWQS